ncbi:group II intron maturase-specific domain-containing protein [Massilia sp.]|uniref:group II intron maturase-specific domain-containing protein n=1 Tax=Massilia sp. TaxID=1882437 RepID=UPI00289BDC8B|nr:group II intron maturase-specific domain-containing protein [Massilia sp.]
MKINDSKSAVTSALGRKFLGYELWTTLKGEVKRVAKKALGTFRQKIRQLTRRSGGRSIAQVIEGLCTYVIEWKRHFGLAQTPKVLNKLDEWMRR